jgi:uncharacterized integral membrane protein
MRITILPKTPLGRWSVGIAAAVILSVLLNILLGPNTLNVLEFSSGSIELRIFFIALCIFGIGALLKGFISMIKSKERSILVFFGFGYRTYFFGDYYFLYYRRTMVNSRTKKSCYLDKYINEDLENKEPLF